MGLEPCCTCAKLLSDILPLSEKGIGRRVECCDRVICWQCIEKNERFRAYCPFCQISTGPSSLPAQGLREPPPYSPPASPRLMQAARASILLDDPPAYSASIPLTQPKEKVEDVLHFISPQESVSSIALAYRVPADALRRKNTLFADNLLAARKTILIPGEHYSGFSLSPKPLESEEENTRKSKIRRFMVASKVSEYVNAY